ncbi:MAG: hypothetical protein AAF772_10475 [Acidobacteriota bacterium]
MGSDPFFRFVFGLYCAVAGLLLIYLPWTSGWERIIAQFPDVLQLLNRPTLRGAVSGFGLVHLVRLMAEIDDTLRAMVRAATDDAPL